MQQVPRKKRKKSMLGKNSPMCYDNDGSCFGSIFQCIQRLLKQLENAEMILKNLES